MKKSIINTLNKLLDTLNENKQLKMPVLKSFLEDYLEKYYEQKYLTRNNQRNNPTHE